MENGKGVRRGLGSFPKMLVRTRVKSDSMSMTTVEVPDRDEWFIDGDGMPRPDWRALRGWMRANAGGYENGEAWRQFVYHWLGRLRASLGGGYAIAESANFHMLSEFDERTRSRLLDWLEAARARVVRTLGEVAWTKTHGKHVILRFGTQEDYYRYVWHGYPDGEHASSSGMFLRGYYSHIALQVSYNLDSERQTLAHELAHNLLSHLPLPSWLNEALAMAFEGDLAGHGHERLNRDLHEKHCAFWDGDTIQEFWAGRSFRNVEGQEVSYSLASILLDNLHKGLRPDAMAFRRFVQQSDAQDAGAAAAREQLDLELGDLAASYLGPGDWQPAPSRWKELAEKSSPKKEEA